PLAKYSLSAYRRRRERNPPMGTKCKYTKVYLIERGNGGVIKVGVTRNVGKRRSDLANSNAEELSILRILHPKNCWPIHIESAFKKLMRPRRLRGEWFRCSDILALVALHVVEQGDLAGCALVRAALVDQPSNHENLLIYGRSLAQRFPYFECFKSVAKTQNYWDSAIMAPNGRYRQVKEQDRRRVSATIS